MSLQHAAQHLAAHGRGPDTVLVHMSKGEVKSLNDLAMAHGGHLTVNPKTGLPEAGFLSSILPMALGFGLNAAFPGLGQIGSGLITGALGMALNPKGGLMGGLMAGMGGYGGAGLGDALAKSGMEQATQQELAQNQAYKAAYANATPLATQLGESYINAAQPSFMGPNMSPEIFAENAQNITEPLNQMRQATAERIAVNSGFGDPSLTTSTAGNRMGTALEGFKSLGGESGRNAFMKNIGGGMGLAKTGMMAAAPLIADAMKEDAPPEVKTDSDPGQQYKYAANATNPAPLADPYGREQTYFDPRYTYAADGGTMDSSGSSDGDTAEPYVPTRYSYDPMAQRFSEIAPVLPQTSQAPDRPAFGGLAKQAFDQAEAPQRYSYNAANQQYTKLATGGISDAYNLGGYSDGGRLLRGPGDGVSDSIPAVIGRKQPARLADGEFVVPARIVSEIGNGSTEAGARKLYAMMDRIQSARSKTMGKGKIAKNSRAEQYLPA